MDAKYFDQLLDCLGDLLAGETTALGKRPDDNWCVGVSSLDLRSLLDYCLILRPLIDAVALGEVEQYRKGLEDGRRGGYTEGEVLGRNSTLEETAVMLEEGGADVMTASELATYLRSLKSNG